MQWGAVDGREVLRNNGISSLVLLIRKVITSGSHTSLVETQHFVPTHQVLECFFFFIQIFPEIGFILTASAVFPQSKLLTFSGYHAELSILSFVIENGSLKIIYFFKNAPFECIVVNVPLLLLY